MRPRHAGGGDDSDEGAGGPVASAVKEMAMIVKHPEGGYISDAPVGPELDADVWRSAFSSSEHWQGRAFSTNAADTLDVLEHMAIGAGVTITWLYDLADDIAGGDGDK
jgi:hypothetical protein